MRAGMQREIEARRASPPLSVIDGAKPGLPPLMPASQLAPRDRRDVALPPLKAPKALTEIMVAGGRDGAASAFAAALAVGPVQDQSEAQAALSKAPQTLVFWVQDALSRLEAGLPYPHGLPGSAAHLALIKARDAADQLWAMEEVLMSGAARAVVGEVWGMPKALTFTATKRLQRAAQIGKTPAILLRYGQAEEGQRPASGAYERWVVESRASARHEADAKAPGPPGWHLDRFKTRLAAPSQWTAYYDPSHHCLTHAAHSGRRSAYEPPHPVHLAAPLGHGAFSKSA